MRTPCPVRPSAWAERALVISRCAPIGGGGPAGGVGGGVVVGGGVGLTPPPPPPPPQALRIATLSAHSASRELRRTADP